MRSVELNELLPDDLVPSSGITGVNTEVVMDHSEAVDTCFHTSVDAHEHVSGVDAVDEVRAAALTLLTRVKLVRIGGQPEL